MIKIFVMQTCPDCTEVKALASGDERFQVIDIGQHVRNLKLFLSLRDTNPAFDSIRAKGSVGIPCFLMEDGSVYFSAEEAGITFSKAQAIPAEESISDGATCSIDGTGC